MFGSASSMQYDSGLGGSAALSHVYTQFPPLRCNIPGLRGLYFDDANKLLLLATSNQVFSWKVVPFEPFFSPASEIIGEGPILCIRYSLDLKFLAVQRSTHEVEFWNRDTGETFLHTCMTQSESILGLFWTDYSSCDIVFVKTSGLELFSCDPETKSLRLVEIKKLNVSWYVYTHESRLILLASGMQCRSFSGFQLSSAGVTRLPRFEMVMAKSEVNSKPVLAAEDIHIVTVYGRIYCLQVDRVAMQMNLYRFYRDAVVRQGSLPIYSSKIGVSVVDNVLLVHQVDAKVVILYDIFSDSRAPISAPLPLMLRGFYKASTSSSKSTSKDPGVSEANVMNDDESTIYGNGWTFLVPDLVCDIGNGLLWKIHLDLEAIAASCSEVPSVLEFLQRRKLEAHKAKNLCFAMLRTVILERRPVSLVSRAIDVLVNTYAHSLKVGTCPQGTKFNKAPPSTMQDSPEPVANESVIRIHTMRKLVKHDSFGRVETGTAGKSKGLSTSDSDDSAAYGLRANSGDCVLGGKSSEENSVGLDNSVAEVQPSAGPGNSALNANVVDPQESQVTSAAISPDEIYSCVFAPVEEEMAGDASYMIAVIIEFLRSVNAEKIKLHPNLHLMTIQLLARNQRFAELGLFIINKILEPSKEVALQLLESGRHDRQTRKLGLDMLRQLSLHQDYILFLVQDGYYLEALRYARNNKVNSLRPSLFLDAAFASNDSQHLASVLRFFSDFIPGFRNTSDHGRYLHILNEMNTSVVS